VFAAAEAEVARAWEDAERDRCTVHLQPLPSEPLDALPAGVCAVTPVPYVLPVREFVIEDDDM